MATVELSFSALPAHVRTARLVAAAVARRSGVDEAVLDEVRLAVGEACSRAVDMHRRHCPHRPVLVTLTDESRSFQVVVTDEAPADATPDGTPHGGPLSGPALDLDDLAGRADLDLDVVPPGVGLAVISGLVDDVSVEHGAGPGGAGVAVRMTWPTSG